MHVCNPSRHYPLGINLHILHRDEPCELHVGRSTPDSVSWHRAACAQRAPRLPGAPKRHLARVRPFLETAQTMRIAREDWEDCHCDWECARTHSGLLLASILRAFTFESFSSLFSSPAFLSWIPFDFNCHSIPPFSPQFDIHPFPNSWDSLAVFRCFAKPDAWKSHPYVFIITLIILFVSLNCQLSPLESYCIPKVTQTWFPLSLLSIRSSQCILYFLHSLDNPICVQVLRDIKFFFSF